MNELVELPVAPVRNSLILIGLTLRTFSAVVSDCLAPFIGLVHEALPIRSPLKLAGPEVTLNVALTLAPGAIGSGNVTDVSVVPGTKDVHCLVGTEMLNFTPAAGDPVVFLNVTVMSCEEPSANVLSPGGVVVADASARLSRSAQSLDVLPGLTQPTRLFSWSVMIHGPDRLPWYQAVALP